MPGKKTRKFGGMPWWYLRKKIIFPIILLTLITVVSVVLFSLFKNKRLSYIPRANEEQCYAGENNYIPVGQQNSGYICCKTGSNGIAWPHFEEGGRCADGEQSAVLPEKVPNAPVANTENTDNIDTTNNDTVVNDKEPTSVPEQKPIQTNNESGAAASKKILILGDSEVASSFVPKEIREGIGTICSDCAFVGSRFDITQSVRMEGFPGYSTERFVTIELPSVLSKLRTNVPDIVVIHFGTNDAVVDGGANFKKNVSTIIDSFIGLNHKAQFIFAQVPLIAIYDKTQDKNIVDSRYSSAIENINTSIRNLGVSYASNPGVTADDFTVSDGVHPGYRGQSKIAGALTAALIPFVRK